MRLRLFLIPCIAMLAVMAISCTSSEELYYWGGYYNSGVERTTRYEQATYLYYKKQTPESFCELVTVLQDMIDHPGGSTNRIPPGVCAEYGFLLLQPNSAELYAQNANKRQLRNGPEASSFRSRGLELLKMEIELYPESAVFITPILKRFSEQ